MGENYRQLDVWKKSVDLATELYALTAGFPEAERQGLASEIREAATSIATHIAEGWGRQSSGEYLWFWGVARTAVVELGTHLEVALHLGLLPSPEHAAVSAHLREISRMLSRLISILRSQTKTTGRGTPCPVSSTPCPLNRPPRPVTAVPSV